MRGFSDYRATRCDKHIALTGLKRGRCRGFYKHIALTGLNHNPVDCALAPCQKLYTSNTGTEASNFPKNFKISYLV